MVEEEKYVQLTSWHELIEWLEREGYKIKPMSDWNPKPKRKKKGPPQEEGLF